MKEEKVGSQSSWKAVALLEEEEEEKKKEKKGKKRIDYFLKYHVANSHVSDLLLSLSSHHKYYSSE